MTEQRKYLPCMACGKPITESSGMDESWPDKHEWHHTPYAATTFYTYGHYGSTFWDSFDGEQCVICICDDCLRANKDRITYVKKVREHPSRWVEFDPANETPASS